MCALKDRNAQKRISARLLRLAEGNPGDHKNLPGDVTELRIDYGPGYRVYYTRYDNVLIILLIGGDKRTQSRDIETAQDMVRNLREGRDDDRY